MADNAKSYTPIDEDPTLMMMDRTNFIGAVLGGGAWGVLLTVSFLTVQALIAYMSSKSQASRNFAIPLLAFVFLIFACGTINYAANTDISRRMFVENRLYPDGPSAYLMEHYDDKINVLGNASYVVANFLADALLLYRCYVVWAKRWWIIIIPACVYIASTTMSILLLYQTSQPTESLWLQVNVGLAYFSLSLAVNLLLTLLIVGRLLAMSNRVKNMLGAQHAHTYTSIAALVVESATPYALTNLVFIITYGIGSPGSNVVLPILSQIMCTSSVLIILRVASGRAWSAQTTDLAYNERGNLMSNLTGSKGRSGTMVVSSIHYKSSDSHERGASSEIDIAEA
ncbi:hypothetical protein GGG16DRAFT_60235 [Schizophyllum commune]